MTVGLLLAILATATPPLASPAEATALYERAAALVEQGDVAQAVGLLQRAAAIDESLGADRRQQLARERGALGLCLSALGRTDDAVTQLGQAVAIWRALDAP